MKLIDLHKKWCELGRMENGCLCWSVPKQYGDGLDLISPTIEERHYHSKEGWEFSFWGRMKKESPGYYNSFRQTIVLLICCMKNEL